jgi:uncharacterized membrane protein YphA (DoxX/SURF4 family)
MKMPSWLDQTHATLKQNRWLRRFTVLTRILLALGFTPSGLTKILGNRFTISFHLCLQRIRRMSNVASGIKIVKELNATFFQSIM